MGFSDILKGLTTGAIDASINPLTVTSERSKKMNFTHPFYASNSTIAVKKTAVFQKVLGFLKSFLSFNFLRGLILLVLIICFFWHYRLAF